jgi:hypothetical protein
LTPIPVFSDNFLKLISSNSFATNTSLCSDGRSLRTSSMVSHIISLSSSFSGVDPSAGRISSRERGPSSLAAEVSV